MTCYECEHSTHCLVHDGPVHDDVADVVDYKAATDESGGQNVEEQTGAVAPNEILMVQAPKIGVTFERTVSVRPYETMKASIYVQADVPIGGTAEGTEQAIRDAFLNAKASVFEQLGIEFSLDEHGVVHEVVTKAFGPVEQVKASNSTANGDNPVPSSNGDKLVCGNDAGHYMYDNRGKKAAGEYKATAPDGKCSTCDYKAWPAKVK